MKSIPYGKQFIDSKDISAVSNALKNDLITTGKLTLKFEHNLNKYLKCKYTSVCNSGTSAIFLSFLAIGIKKNDKIIMPAVNFVSSYNLAKSLGAQVFLADVDNRTGQMTPENVDACCKKFNLKKVKALIIMYNGGNPVNANKFIKFKKKLNCFIIEDACHALGAEYKDKKKNFKIGSCKHCDISTFSLHPLKTITTGEGGIVTTNSKLLDNKIKMFRSIGIKRTKNKHWKYDVILSGFNFRMNEFQCSLGISQLKKIKLFLKKRSEITDLYNKKLKNVSQLNLPENVASYKSASHLYIVNLKKPNYQTKENLLKFMKKNGILIQFHYIPIYKFKNFKGKYISKNSEIYFKSAFSLPIFYELTRKKQIYVIKKIKSFFGLNE